MRENKPPYLALVTVVVCSVLGLLAWSIWHHDYRLPTQRPRAPSAILHPSLRVVPGDGPGTVWAEFSLSNEGAARARVLNTLALNPLFQVLVEQALPDGQWSSVPLLPPVIIDVDLARALDGDRDGVVELLPKHVITRRIDLGALYRLKNEGKYRVTVTYQPMQVAAQAGEDEFGLWAVDRALFRTLAEFELPWKPAAPALVAPETRKPTGLKAVEVLK